MPFLTRYDDDPAEPAVRSALRDMAARALAPGVLVWLAIVGMGFVITGPLRDLPAEDQVNRDLQGVRSSTWDAVTNVWSRLGNTEVIIGTCIVLVGVIWWLTRKWWIAVIPALAVSLQATIFVIAAAVIGRDRPEVDQLDPAPPTSSYPSGHVGASVALYLSLALIARRVPQPVLRRLLLAVCFLVPVLVSYARLYRGMHQLTDVVVGVANGVACALLAWAYLRRRH